MFYVTQPGDADVAAALSPGGAVALGLGVVVGGQCYFRFVAPAQADPAAGFIAGEGTTQCSPEAILQVVPPPWDEGSLRAARSRAEAALAARALQRDN